MEEEDSNVWEFNNIFKSHESRISFIIDVLDAFENFPSDTRLNCDDYYSIFSTICNNLPYQFIVFVCECVDPSISSGTLLSHRIAFGNFLLALPCCILFSQFTHYLLTLFKNADKLRSGIISRSTFLTILKATYSNFFEMVKIEKSNNGKANQEEEDEEDDYDEPEYERVPTIDPKRIPDESMVNEVQRATKDLDELSIQTLFFVMWQKESTLIRCKSRIKIDPSVQSQKEEEEEDFLDDSTEEGN